MTTYLLALSILHPIFGPSAQVGMKTTSVYVLITQCDTLITTVL